MQMFKQWFYLATSLALFGILVSCGVPPTGSTSSTAPTTGSEATVGNAPTTEVVVTPDAAVTPETSITPDTTATTETMSPDTTATAGGTSSAVDGTKWQLTEYGAEGSMTNASGEVTLVFGPGDTVGGNSGCNSYSGTYTLDGETFSVSNVASTMMACIDNDLMTQEGAFTGALTTATGLTIDGDTLTITYPDGMLRFTRQGAVAASPLEGTIWNLESFVTGTGDSATASSVVAGSMITAEWANGSVHGNAGCNQYSANYTLGGETLEVGAVVATRMACEGPVMEQETTFINALDAATRLEIVNGNLVVTYPDGQLIFTSGS